MDADEPFGRALSGTDRGNRGACMELLDVTLTALQRRNRAAFVDRRDPAAPPLIPGQKVVLRDEDGEYFAGTVVDEQGGSVGARYLVHLGVRLPEEYALMRLGQQRPSPDAERIDELQAMLDLLGDARESLGRVPSQRHTS
jgi:hypothetical protein